MTTLPCTHDGANLMGAHTWTTHHLWASMGDCPFCGASAAEFNIGLSYSENVDGVFQSFMGECSECGAMGPYASTEHAALRLWNFRAKAASQ